MYRKHALTWLWALALTGPHHAWCLAEEGAGARPQPGAAGPAQAAAACRKEAPDWREWTALLSGTWQFAPAGSTESAAVAVPGFWSSAPQMGSRPWEAAAKLKSGTYRRSFRVPKEKPGVVVDFEMIRWGGEVFVNGRSAGQYDLGYSPAAFDVSGLVKAGGNQLAVTCRGWAGLERHQGKDVQIPVAAANWWGSKSGGIPGDVHVRFYRGARIGPLRIVTRIDGRRCDLTATLAAGAAPWTGRLAAQVLSDDARQPLSPARRTMRAAMMPTMSSTMLKLGWAPGAAPNPRLTSGLANQGWARDIAVSSRASAKAPKARPRLGLTKSSSRKRIFRLFMQAWQTLLQAGITCPHVSQRSFFSSGWADSSTPSSPSCPPRKMRSSRRCSLDAALACRRVKRNSAAGPLSAVTRRIPIPSPSTILADPNSPVRSHPPRHWPLSRRK